VLAGVVLEEKEETIKLQQVALEIKTQKKVGIETVGLCRT